MTIHKYAFMTQFSENNYEVFHIARLDQSDEFHLDTISRFDLALSSGELISGLEATGKESGLLKGSLWNGNSFSLPEILPPNLPQEYASGLLSTGLDGLTRNHYVMLQGNKVFYIIGVESSTGQALKLSAAFTNNVTFRKIEESDGIVSLGMIWDGSSWSAPNLN